MRISVIITNWYRVCFIPEILAQLDMQKYPKSKYEIVIVDNNSPNKEETHNIHERKEEILRVLRKALKLKGFFLMTENTLSEGSTTDGYSFTVSGWESFMRENGFQLIEAIMPWPYYWFQCDSRN